MKLADYLDESWIDADLAPDDRDDALRRIAGMLHAAGAVSDPAEAARRLIEREDVMSTSVDPGVALPHSLCASASRTVVSVCRCPGGVDFKAPSGEPVRLVFALLGPPDARETHVKLLACIARILKNRDLRQQLLDASTAGDLAALLGVQGQEVST